MVDIESLYKKENGRILIEIKLSSVAQLFNSFDPAPFHEKELDSAAEHYIVDMVKDFPPKTLFKMIIYLPQDIATTERAMKIPTAIHNHFQFRMLVADRKFRSHFRAWQEHTSYRPYLPHHSPDSTAACFIPGESYNRPAFCRRTPDYRLGCDVGTNHCPAVRTLAYHPAEKNLRKDQQHAN